MLLAIEKEKYIKIDILCLKYPNNTVHLSS